MSLSAHVVVIKNGEILLIQREDFKVWVLPGGQVEKGESVAQAAVREVAEETGIEVVLTGLLGIYSMPYWIGDPHNVVFAARPVGGILRPQQGEADDVGYFSADRPPERLPWWHCQPIHDAISGVRGSAVWQQDVRWPADWMSAQEAFALRDQGALPESLIRASWEVWCREPQPGEQWREIEEE
ncbi:MAG: NUDIX domain-containing protein [Ktedonobacteraceae bacterium]|nr:NUDIX domain-containing protein [Ktedonobacteraceae bacterium]